MDIPEEALELIREAEGCKLTAYLCPAGVPTVGWGSTGPGVTLGATITQEVAERLFEQDIARAAKSVDGMVIVPLTPLQRGALVSLCFNIGPAKLRSSTLIRLLNARDYGGAGDQFPRWVYGTVGGKPTKLPGLVRRRAAERELFRRLPWR